jgi:hypothetical protein
LAAFQQEQLRAECVIDVLVGQQDILQHSFQTPPVYAIQLRTHDGSLASQLMTSRTVTLEDLLSQLLPLLQLPLPNPLASQFRVQLYLFRRDGLALLQLRQPGLEPLLHLPGARHPGFVCWR